MNDITMNKQAREKTEESGFSSLEPEPEPQEPAPQEETVVEEVAEELHVELPRVNLPVPMKFVALITLIGGLGIVGSSFTDFLSPRNGTFWLYIGRLIAGFAFIAISYGLIKRQNWATWLYALLVIAGLFINWIFALLPAIIVLYLIYNRHYLYTSPFDRVLHRLSESISKRLKT